MHIAFIAFVVRWVVRWVIIIVWSVMVARGGFLSALAVLGELG